MQGANGSGPPPKRMEVEDGWGGIKRLTFDLLSLKGRDLVPWLCVSGAHREDSGKTVACQACKNMGLGEIQTECVRGVAVGRERKEGLWRNPRSESTLLYRWEFGRKKARE